jgi:cytosine/uracil/thiamine/allantoin permease
MTKGRAAASVAGWTAGAVAATMKAFLFSCVASICQRSSPLEWMYSSGQFVSVVPGTATHESLKTRWSVESK